MAGISGRGYTEFGTLVANRRILHGEHVAVHTRDGVRGFGIVASPDYFFPMLFDGDGETPTPQSYSERTGEHYHTPKDVIKRRTRWEVAV